MYIHSLKKKIGALLLASCLSTFSLQASTTKTAPQFEVLKEKGLLYFGFTPIASATPNLPQGLWQASVITPDGKVFKGPKINASKPHAYFRIKVRHPILRGTYRLIVENISVTNFTGSFTKAFVHVKRPSSHHVVNVALTSQFDSTLGISEPNDPGTILQGEFTPYNSFIFQR